MYDFDTITDRNTQDDIKYQKIEGIDDLIPMWVADMDFKCPPEVSDALVKIAQNGIFGYSEAGSEYDEAVISWLRDGALICIGLGNDDWNQSAPHGAGRLFSRSQAESSFTLSAFKKSMEGYLSAPFR